MTSSSARRRPMPQKIRNYIVCGMVGKRRASRVVNGEAQTARKRQSQVSEPDNASMSESLKQKRWRCRTFSRGVRRVYRGLSDTWANSSAP